MNKHSYDPTVAQIAGTILSGAVDGHTLAEIRHGREDWSAEVRGAVALARAIVAETERTEPREVTHEETDAETQDGARQTVPLVQDVPQVGATGPVVADQSARRSEET